VSCAGNDAKRHEPAGDGVCGDGQTQPWRLETVNSKLPKCRFTITLFSAGNGLYWIRLTVWLNLFSHDESGLFDLMNIGNVSRFCGTNFYCPRMILVLHLSLQTGFPNDGAA
jgi:hypothetical protein